MGYWKHSATRLLKEQCNRATESTVQLGYWKHSATGLLKEQCNWATESTVQLGYWKNSANGLLKAQCNWDTVYWRHSPAGLLKQQLSSVMFHNSWRCYKVDHMALLTGHCLASVFHSLHFITAVFFYAEWDTCKSNIHGSEMWEGGNWEQTCVLEGKCLRRCVFYLVSSEWVITDIEISCALTLSWSWDMTRRWLLLG